MRWSKGLIKYRLHYFLAFKNYGMGSDADPIPKVGKKTRRTTDAYFVTLALDNAFVDEAFGTLSDMEQKILTELYVVDSRDESHYDEYHEWRIKIFYAEGAMQGLIGKTGMIGGKINRMAQDALAKMAEYLNG